jgi:excisionase family DNA binding protein
MTPSWVSLLQAAELTGLSGSFLRRKIKSGELPAVNASSARRPLYRIKLTDLEAWLEGRKEKGGNVVPPRTERRRLVERYFG